MNPLTWFSSAKLWLIGIALVTALVALILWRVFAAGRAAAQADIAIAGLRKAIEANQKRQQMANRSPEQKEKDRANDPFNRDTWRR
jgi:type II secretory pathway pseudopilin PulG